MQFELRNHPSQARHPITKAPLTDESGKPVPLFPEMRSIYLDGKLIGYCQSRPGYPVSLIVNVSDGVRNSIFEFVESRIGRVESVNMPPEVSTDDKGSHDEFDDGE